MGWRGTLRSINAAANRAEREARRRQRELERRQAEYEKMLEKEQAAHDVASFENYVERLQSIHKECSKPISWSAIANQPEPQKPAYSDEREREAKHRLNTYKPGLFDKIFNRIDKRTDALRDGVTNAKRDDEAAHQDALKEYEQDLEAWQVETSLAKSVLDLDPESLKDAVEKYGGYSEIEELGTHLSFSFTDKAFVRCEIEVHGEEIVPTESKRLLKSGKLSIKAMNKGEFYELFQDYVCSTVLRVARETFAVIPIEKLEITAIDELLNSATGHLEKQPILSVLVARETLEKLNLNAIDPSDSMKNFVHEMDFKRTKGFAPVKQLAWEEDQD